MSVSRRAAKGKKKRCEVLLLEDESCAGPPTVWRMKRAFDKVERV
jgi:hypothetical protein